ncbi:MAG: hypothetical protein PHD81_03475 [Candidatus Nanoarchaeia archaeon]|nr:hypothetical protein [Candidatus Nanoarchaeia archaeon]MDD5588145.1 hypothetical protein [Candidatus Nanoarchaeia archaeon]
MSSDEYCRLDPDLISSEELFEDDISNLKQLFTKKAENELNVRIAEAFKIPLEKMKELDKISKKVSDQTMTQMNRLIPPFDFPYFDEFRYKVYINYLNEVLNRLLNEKENPKKSCETCSNLLESKIRGIILVRCNWSYRLGKKNCSKFDYNIDTNGTIYMNSLNKRIEVVNKFLYEIDGIPLH